MKEEMVSKRKRNLSTRWIYVLIELSIRFGIVTEKRGNGEEEMEERIVGPTLDTYVKYKSGVWLGSNRLLSHKKSMSID